MTTRLAALHARITGDASSFVKAATQAGDAAVKAGQKIGNTAVGGLGKAAGAARASINKLASAPGIRMLPIQLSQVAQQAAAGGGLLRSLSIQAADIGMIFGTTGVIIGSLATLGVPLLMNAFSGLSDETETLEGSLEKLDNRMSTVGNATDILEMDIDDLIAKFGEGAMAAREMALAIIETEVELARRDMANLAAEIGDVADEYRILGRENAARNREIRRELQITRDEHVRLSEAIVDLQEAEGLAAQVEAAQDLRRIMEDLGIETEELSNDFLLAESNLAQAQARALEMEQALRDAEIAAADFSSELANAAMNFGNVNALAGLTGQELLPPAFAPDDEETRRRGGGRGRDPRQQMQEELDRLHEQLLSELELEQEMHEERNNILRTAKENELLTHQEYNDLIERERDRHHEKMAALDVWRYGSSSQQLEAFLGQMASAFASGNEEMLEIAKVFGAGEALINAWRTYSQVMSDPSLPWFAKLPAALSLFGSAVQAVDAIQSVGKGGSGRTTAGGAATEAQTAPTAAQPTQQRSLTLIGDRFNRAQAIEIAEFSNEASDDGLVIRGRR